MFDLRPIALTNSFSSEAPRGNDHALLLNQAVNLFNHIRLTAHVEKIWFGLLNRARNLFDIEAIPANKVVTRRYGGIKPVNLDCICGTLGRTSDFDTRFQPLSDRMRDRWVSIAIARSMNIPLQPVELIQIGDCYFVKDGHHRISVARARGEAAVDAEVTIWDVNGPLPWEVQSTPRILTQMI